MAEAVTSATWDQEVLKANGLVLVDFWAVWCGPCRMVAPIVDEISKEYEGKLKVLKLNTDENPDVAGKYRIMGIPTLMFFKNGQTIDQVVGAVPKTQLKSKVDALLANRSFRETCHCVSGDCRMRPHELPDESGQLWFFTVCCKEICSDVDKKNGIIAFRDRIVYRLHKQERTDRQCCIRFHPPGYGRQESGSC